MMNGSYRMVPDKLVLTIVPVKSASMLSNYPFLC